MHARFTIFGLREKSKKTLMKEMIPNKENERHHVSTMISSGTVFEKKHQQQSCVAAFEAPQLIQLPRVSLLLPIYCSNKTHVDTTKKRQTSKDLLWWRTVYLRCPLLLLLLLLPIMNNNNNNHNKRNCMIQLATKKEK